MYGSGREALADVRELSREPPGWPGVVGSHCKYPGVFGRPSQISGSGRETLPDVRELSVGPPGCPADVGRTSRIYGSGLETIPDFW